MFRMWKRMTSKALQAGVLLVLTVLMTGAVRSDPLDGAAIQGPAQHYVMTRPEAPVGEIAQEVLGETPGLPVGADLDADRNSSSRSTPSAWGPTISTTSPRRSGVTRNISLRSRTS